MNEYRNDCNNHDNDYGMDYDYPMQPYPWWGGMYSPGMMEGMPGCPGMGMMPQPYPPMPMPENMDKDYLCYMEHMHRCMAHLCEAEAYRCKAMQHMMEMDKEKR
ncbi:MAG TPA: hypothetical protein GX503_04325 [Clostridiales bacterium]|nr:hypothetical protein [Clostridiales bacterium]